jgi:tetratricopeptide (TPR) repeat protein
LAATLRAKARFAEAEEMYRSALTMRQTEPEPSPVRIASALYGLALLDRDTGRFAEAERLARRALDDGIDQASALDLIGTVVRSQGRLREARSLLQRALEAAQGSPGASGQTLAGILIDLGNAERLVGNLTDAQAHLSRAAELLKGARAKVTLAIALDGLAEVARARGDLKRARQTCEQASSLLRAAVGTDHPDYAVSLATLAAVYADVHNARKARELFLEVLRIDERTLGPAHPRVGFDLDNLGVTSARLHDNASAESYLRRALTVQSNPMQSAFWRANLAGLYAREGKRVEALELYRDATAVLRDAHAPGLRVAEILEEYAALLRRAGSFAEAEDAQTRAMHIRVRHAVANQDGSDRT